jgi:PAS domain S-box-containing protein
MKKLEEFEKKLQQLREKNEKTRETVSHLKKENAALKKELNDKKLLLGKAPAGIVLIWRGRILEVNDTFLDYMGYKADEMINRNFLNFVHPDHLSEVRFIHNKWSAGRVTRGQYDTILVTENEDRILCSIESKRVRYRGRASYILNITRLEEREKNQKELRYEINRKTESEITHGFKTLLKKKSGPVLDLIKRLKEHGDEHDESIEHIIRMLRSEHENILRDAAMLETITAETRPYQNEKVREINRIVNDALLRAKDTAEKTEVKIKTFLRAGSSVAGNPDELTDAVTQLLLHSVSNISGEGEIHITTEDNPDNIYIFIQESGLNVESKDAETVFEPFSADEDSPVHEFGMRFLKAVVQRHNGEIEYSPGRGHGNIFEITIPVFKEEKIRRKVDLKKLKKARTLIIQEEDIAKELLAHLLSEKGCRVDKTESSIEGLNIIKKRKINLLVADTERLGINDTLYFKKCRQINPNLITVGMYNGLKIKEKKRDEETPPDLIIRKPFDIKGAVKSIAELFMVKFQ